MSKKERGFAFHFAFAGMNTEAIPYSVVGIQLVPLELFDGPIDKSKLYTQSEINKMYGLLAKYKPKTWPENNHDAQNVLIELSKKIKSKVR